jgi:hypothetical protein
MNLLLFAKDDCGKLMHRQGWKGRCYNNTMASTNTFRMYVPEYLLRILDRYSKSSRLRNDGGWLGSILTRLVVSVRHPCHTWEKSMSGRIRLPKNGGDLGMVSKAAGWFLY